MWLGTLPTLLFSVGAIQGVELFGVKTIANKACSSIIPFATFFFLPALFLPVFFCQPIALAVSLLIGSLLIGAGSKKIVLGIEFLFVVIMRG